MVLELVLIFLCFGLMPLLVLRNKGRQKNKRHQANNDTSGCGKLPEIGYWETLWGMLLLVTVNWNMPNYEWSYLTGKQKGHTVIIKLPMSPRTNINSNDLEFCKKVMSSPLWPDRLYEAHYMHCSTFDKPLGLLFGCGELREKSSRLTVKLLHQLYFFKPSKMEGFISFEMSEIEADLVQRIEASPGGALIFSPHTVFEAATLNVVCQVLFGKRYRADDPLIRDMLEKVNVANREFSLGYTSNEFIPWLKYFPKLTFLHSLMTAADACYGICQKIIKNKRKKQCASFQEQAEDFVDAFLHEIDKNEDKMLSDEMLLALICCWDMIFAGSDTVNSTLEHGLLHVSLHQEVQRKIQCEIDEVIGQSRAPVYNDKARMPYTQAVLLETLRVASPVPGTIRATKEQTRWEGCPNPLQKGSQIGINLYGIHHSKEIWDDPFIFRPERFLNADGTLVNVEKIMPFGYGKRACVGESVARVTLFIFFVTLLQKFTFEISPAHPAPSFQNPKGLSRCPMPYFVVARKRVVS